MNVGLVTLNAKFVHVALSLRYLRNAARHAGFNNVWIAEYTIDQPIWKVSADIQRHKPDVIGIGIYIWNRTESFQLIEMLRKQNPKLSVAVGGPEVSFEPVIVPDYTVIGGEGESKWIEFLQFQQRGETPSTGVLERWKTYGNSAPNLIPAYIEEDFPGLENRMTYIETSRGCPYLCSFCLSALDKKVRFFDDGVLRQQIEYLTGCGVKTIKFIDRTFNIQGRRIMDWMHWLSKFKGVSFHFEVVGDLLSDEILDFLDTVPSGMFQFEIGVQTTDEESQSSIRRKQNNKKLFKAIHRIAKQNKIHLHCDLIFGLPGETKQDCLRSFVDVFQLQPHELQLGFLKFLPGAPIRNKIESCDYRHQSHPPYEVIAHADLPAKDVIYLKQFADIFNRFYNSKRFHFSIANLLKSHSPVELFDRLLKRMESRNLLNRLMSLDNLYREFYETFETANHLLSIDLLRLDYLYRQKTFRLPPFMSDLVGKRENGGKLKIWTGNKKSPLFPFTHTIEINGGEAVLKPSPKRVYYAFVHSKQGYIAEPLLVCETVNDE